MRLRTRNNRQSRRGAALVELALALPIFFMVVLAIVEFGRAMMVSNLLANSAREGARSAIMEGSTNAEVEEMISDFLTAALGGAASSADVTITVTAGPGNPDPGNSLASAQRDDVCTIRVDIPFDQVSFIPGDYLSGKTLSAYSVMRHE